MTVDTASFNQIDGHELRVVKSARDLQDTKIPIR